MKVRKLPIIIGIMTAGIGTILGAGLSGCGRSEAGIPTDMNIRQEAAQIADWQVQLSRQSDWEAVNAASIRGLTVHKNGEEVFGVSYEPNKYKDSFAYWTISQPYDSTVTVNTETLYQLFGVIENLKLKRAEADSSNAGLTEEEAGIDKGNRVFIAYSNGEQAKPDQGQELFLGKEDGNGNYYAILSGSSQIYLAEKTAIDSILNLEPFTYILRISALLNIDTVSKVTVQTENKQYHLDMNDKERYNELLSILIEKEIPAEEEQREQPLLSVAYQRTEEEASDCLVQYYPYDQEYAVVEVNGKSHFLVKLEEVQKRIQLFAK